MKFNPEPWNHAVDAALALLATQRHERTMSHYIDFAHYAMENNTIKLCAGPVTGLSTWIGFVATEHDLIVVPTVALRESTRRTMNPKAQVIAVEECKLGLTKNYQRIYVDSASFMTGEALRTLYRATSKTPDQRWLLLG